MVAGEFDRARGHIFVSTFRSTPFPSEARTEKLAMNAGSSHFSRNKFELEKNFTATFRLSARPGGVLRFYISSDHAQYECRLVRLLHGDTNPLGPGSRQELIPSQIDGEYSGRVQALASGSYADLPLAASATNAGVGFGIYLQPWDPDRGDQVIACHGGGDGGWSVGLDADGEIFLCLSANGYQNSVSQVTENVLRAFLKEPSAVAPEGPQ